MLLSLIFIALLGASYTHPTTPFQTIKQDSHSEFLQTKKAQWNDTTTITGDNFSAETFIYQCDSTDGTGRDKERILSWQVRQTKHLENQYISADYTTLFWGRMDYRTTAQGELDIRDANQWWAQVIEVETFTGSAEAYNVELLSTINTSLYGTWHDGNNDTPIQLKWDNTENNDYETYGIELGTGIQTEANIETLKTTQDPDEIDEAFWPLVQIGEEYRLRFNTTTALQSNSVEMTGTAAKGDERHFNKQNFMILTKIERSRFQLINTNTKENITNTMWDDATLLNNTTWNAQLYAKETMRLKMAVQYIPTQGGEVIDIGGLMFDIIGMPFTFISQAFDVTLFPGTQYQLNIGNLIKGLIAILTVLFIIKLFTKGIDVLGNYTGSIQKNKDAKEDRSWKREQRQMQREKHQKDMSKNE